MLDEARLAEGAQERVGVALDQRAGVVLGFAGLLVTVLAGQSGWDIVAASVLAGLAAAASSVALMRRYTATISPLTLMELYQDNPRGEVVAAIAGTSAYLYDERAGALSRKGLWLMTAAVLLVAAIAILVAGVTVDAATSRTTQVTTTETGGATDDRTEG